MFGLFISRLGVVCGQFRFFVYAQGVDRVRPGKGPNTGTNQQWIPQHFPNVRTGAASFYTSDPHRCPQQTDEKFSCREDRTVTGSWRLQPIDPGH